MSTRTLGSHNRLPQIQIDLRALWLSVFMETLSVNRVKNESAIRDTLAKLEKEVFGAARSQNNDVFSRVRALKEHVFVD